MIKKYLTINLSKNYFLTVEINFISFDSYKYFVKYTGLELK